jgi:chromosome segregation ATPase
MRKTEVPRRSSAFEDFFAERQVYLRSGSTSRYVVLSRPLQITVAVGAGLIVAGLAFASYGLVVNHLEAAELRRELALAEARIGELSAARQADGPVTATTGAAEDASTAQPAESESSAAQRIAELARQLATADARADRLQGDLEAALADAAALRQAAETAEADRDDLQAEIARLRERPPAAGQAGQDLAQIKEPATAEADAVSALKASLAGAEAQIATLSADLEAAKGELAAAREKSALTAALADQPAAGAASGADELARMRAELRTANQRIAELEAAIRRGLAELAPPPAPPAPR